jgi:hypothetical protein
MVLCLECGSLLPLSVFRSTTRGSSLPPPPATAGGTDGNAAPWYRRTPYRWPVGGSTPGRPHPLPRDVLTVTLHCGIDAPVLIAGGPGAQRPSVPPAVAGGSENPASGLGRWIANCPLLNADCAFDRGYQKCAISSSSGCRSHMRSKTG